MLGLSTASVEKLLLRATSLSFDSVQLRNVVLKDVIGEGTAALVLWCYLCHCNHIKVYKGMWHGTPVAVKQFHETPDYNVLLRDAVALATLRHPNLIQVFLKSCLTHANCFSSME